MFIFIFTSATLVGTPDDKVVGSSPQHHHAVAFTATASAL